MQPRALVSLFILQQVYLLTGIEDRGVWVKDMEKN